MNTVDKLNNVLGWLTAMNFDRPELSNDLEEPLNTLSEAISEVENLSLSGFVSSAFLVQHKENLINYGLFSTRKKAENYINKNTDLFGIQEVKIA